MQVRKSATSLVALLQGVQLLLPENLVDQVRTLHKIIENLPLKSESTLVLGIYYFHENPPPDSLNVDWEKIP
jgi:hypothetical protein